MRLRCVVFCIQLYCALYDTDEKTLSKELSVVFHKSIYASARKCVMEGGGGLAFCNFVCTRNTMAY